MRERERDNEKSLILTIQILSRGNLFIYIFFLLCLAHLANVCLSFAFLVWLVIWWTNIYIYLFIYINNIYKLRHIM